MYTLQMNYVVTEKAQVKIFVICCVVCRKNIQWNEMLHILPAHWPTISSFIQCVGKLLRLVTDVRVHV